MRLGLLVLALAAMPQPSLFAQQPDIAREQAGALRVCAPARTALVLAGGGAKGAVHIGFAVKYHLGGPVYLVNESASGNIFDENDVRARLTLPPDKYIEGARIGLEILTPLGPVRMEIGNNNFSGRPQASLSIGNGR